jgi:riboflavin synthase
MFSGIVEEIGVVLSLAPKARSKVMELVVRRPAGWDKVKKGASICVSGVCLTVTKVSSKELGFDVVSETLERSLLGGLRRGDRVNLERALEWKGRVEGHFVLGHVDGTGRVQKVVNKPKEKSYLIACDPALGRNLIEKGSVAVSGVSLTLGKVTRKSFWLHCIPYTLAHTTLGDLTAGSRVNIEIDLLAKRR